MTDRNEILKLRAMVEAQALLDPFAPLPAQLYAVVNELDDRLSAIEKGLRELNQALRKSTPAADEVISRRY